MKKIFAFSLLVVLHHAFGQTMLVSKEEMLASISAPVMPVAKVILEKDSPRIDIAKPNLAVPLSSPTPIQLHFEAVAPSTIKPESFRVLYGAFEIDITQRLLVAGKLSANGINVQEANLPSGKHRIQLSIEDTLGRKCVRLIEFFIN